MKSGLTSYIFNELEVLSWQIKEREKAIKMLAELKANENKYKVKETVNILNGKITVYQKLKTRK